MKNLVNFLLFLAFLNLPAFLFAQKITDLAQMSYEELNNKYNNLDNKKAEAILYVNAYILKAKIENNPLRLFYGYKSAAAFSNDIKKLAYVDSMVWAAENTKDKDIIGSAWLSRGVNLYNLRNYTSALDAYNKAEEHLKETKDAYLKYKVLYNIALVNAYLGHHEIAISKFEECKIHFYNSIETSTHPNEEYNNRKYYLFTLHRLANLYQSLGQLGKSKELVEIGMKESSDTEFWYERALLEKTLAVQKFYEGDYKMSMEILKSLVPLFTKEDNFNWVAVSYFYIGKNLESLQKDNEAIEYFQKIDSIFQKRNYLNPELREAYEILLTHYRAEDNRESKLYYIERLVELNKLMEKDFVYLNSTLHKKKEFETANLILEKKQIEKSSQSQSLFYQILIGIAGILVIAISGKLYITHRKNKQLKLLLDRPKIKSLTEELTEEKSIGSNKLPIEKIDELLEKLKSFEREKEFNEPGLTIEILSKKLETNSRYLSFVINNHLGKNFNAYLNELRINHLIDELKSNPYIRTLKMDELAVKSGYTNRQSFSRAFRSIAKVSPASFIENISEFKEEEIFV